MGILDKLWLWNVVIFAEVAARFSSNR